MDRPRPSGYRGREIAASLDLDSVGSFGGDLSDREKPLEPVGALDPALVILPYVEKHTAEFEVAQARSAPQSPASQGAAV